MASKAHPQSVSPGFNGFPEEGIRFLRRLKQHNDRDWFREHKEMYDQYVHEPMKALVFAVSADCRARGLPLHIKEKSPVMRVYRDIRFSKDKSPFKTHVAAELRRSFSGSNCLLYIHIGPDESLLAAGVWQPERPLLHAWREMIVREPDRFERMRSTASGRGLDLYSGHSLSMMPRGFQNYSNEAFGRWLKLTSFVVERPLRPSDYSGPGFVQTVVEFALAAKPLFEFGWRVEETESKSFPKHIHEGDVV